LIHVGSKGFPAVEGPVAVGDIAGRGWTLSDLPTPVMVLRERALAHNLSVMAEYCRAWGVDIAPHGKTTMAPQLWDRQLAAGAWGITAATVDQARVMRASSIPRVLLANELVDPVSIAWVAEQLTDPAFDLICYVDSDRGVTILEEHLRAHRPARPLSVLVELGFDGGRTGCRTIPEAVHVAGRVSSSDVLHLAGVAAFADIDRLTIFADNLVPHVLRLDGVLVYSDALARRAGVPPRTLDNRLWNRGQQPPYSTTRTHVTRTVFY